MALNFVWLQVLQQFIAVAVVLDVLAPASTKEKEGAALLSQDDAAAADHDVNNKKLIGSGNLTDWQTENVGNLLHASRELFTEVFIPSEVADSALNNSTVDSMHGKISPGYSVLHVEEEVNRFGARLRPFPEEMPINKLPKAALSFAASGLSEISVPGPMTSVPLYLIDVMLLPAENSLAVMVLGSRNYDAVREAVHDRLGNADPAEILAKLPVALRGVPPAYSQGGASGGGNDNKRQNHDDPAVFLDQRRTDELKCAILSPRVPDENCVGGSHILLCRAVGVSLQDSLRGVSSGTLQVQLGNELVTVSAKTLSAGVAGYTISRPYPASPNNRHLRASVVVPQFGQVPPYWDETMRFFNVSGISHVYVGVYNEEPRGKTRKILQKYISSGYLSLLELDEWKNLDWKTLFSMDHKADKSQPPKVKAKDEAVISIINDWALYHAKNFDDLQLVTDYDEFMVPTGGESLPETIMGLARRQWLPSKATPASMLPATVFNGLARPLPPLEPVAVSVDASERQGQSGLKALRHHLDKFCFFMVCPVVTYGNQDSDSTSKRNSHAFEGRKSRAADFPFMDGGVPGYKVNEAHAAGDPALDWCTLEAGHTNTYPKSVSVVRTVYKTSVHVPGACSALYFSDGGENQANTGPFVRVWRKDGLVVQHFTELRITGRFVDKTKGHKQLPSYYTNIWAPKLRGMPPPFDDDGGDAAIAAAAAFTQARHAATGVASAGGDSGGNSTLAAATAWSFFAASARAPAPVPIRSEKRP